MSERLKEMKSNPLLRDSQVLKRDKVLKHLNENTVNPFVNSTPKNGFIEWLKIIIFGLTLFPIRVLSFITLLLIAVGISNIALFGLDKKDVLTKPLPKSRRLILSPFPLVYFKINSIFLIFFNFFSKKKIININISIRYLFRALLFIQGYYWIPVKGKRDNSAPIIVMNHVAFMEAIYLLYARFPHMVAKKETIGSFFIIFF